MAIGDGISSGETSYKIDGISYNDYLKEYFYTNKLLKHYNNDYSYKNYKINDLLNDLNNKNYNKLNIQQTLNKANLITLSIGEEELVKLAITEDLNTKEIKKFILNYDKLISIIKELTDAKIFIIGFYENKYLEKSSVIILNSELSNIANKYDSTFININDLLKNKDYYLDTKTYYFNYRGHKEIAEMIINSL